MNLQEWNIRLAEALTTEDVLWVLRDFLSRWTPEQIEELPEDCRPGRFNDADEVSEYAFKLVQKQCRVDAFTSPRLHTMASFVASAAQRMSQIAAFMAHLRSTDKAVLPH